MTTGNGVVASCTDAVTSGAETCCTGSEIAKNCSVFGSEASSGIWITSFDSLVLCCAPAVLLLMVLATIPPNNWRVDEGEFKVVPG